MPVQLFSHNMQAYAAVKAMLDRMSKAAVIHPTGTGKSFIAFKWIEEHPGERFVWLLPSEYIFGVQRENILHSDADYPMNRIVFLTYARLMWMTDEELEALSPYGIILDEFHRCGGKRWDDGVRRLLNMYPEAKLLGLSSTQIRYLDGQREAIGMRWSVYGEGWQNAYEEARRFYETHGHLNVPQRYETTSGVKLGDWVSNIRRAVRRGKAMDEKRYAQLNQIGMFARQAHL